MTPTYLRTETDFHGPFFRKKALVEAVREVIRGNPEGHRKCEILGFREYLRESRYEHVQ